MIHHVFTLAIVVIASSAPAFGQALSEPIPILAGGVPIDVAQQGEAAPFVVDFDGDGKKDLLVRDQFRLGRENLGRVRLYRNVGTNVEPKFDAFRYFDKGAASTYLIPSGASGPPSVADLNGDGLRDLILASWPFEMRLYRGRKDGVEDEGDIIIPVGRISSDGGQIAMHLVDWDGDGDLDLILGSGFQRSLGGHVVLARNDGTPKEPKFGDPVPISADGKPIQAHSSAACPVVADWDADGKLDLVLGNGDGSVLWFRNLGTRQEPIFGPSQVLLPVPAVGAQRGSPAYPHVVDWNEDGRLDVVIGDSGPEFQKQLTDEDLQLRGEAKSQQMAAFTEWAAVFNRYRQLMNDARDPTAARLIDAELNATRNKLIELNAVRDRHYQLEQLIQGGRQTHGRVWLLLRK
jgi:hypothetical protein